MWDIEFTDEFGAWWSALSLADQRSVSAGVELNGENGPTLGYPYSSGIQCSRHPNMRELRVQSGG